MIRRTLGLALVMAVTLSASVQAAMWEIDSNHSSAAFKIRHIFSKVPGQFKEVSGIIEYDAENPTQARVEATLPVASIDTRNERRDGHLRSPDFFDAENHPQITFKSTQVEPTDSGLRVTGDLTMRGVTKPVVLEVEVLGAGSHPSIPDGQVAGFTATTRLNRQDFGIQWNKVLDQGGTLLGDEVEIVLEIEAVSAPES